MALSLDDVLATVNKQRAASGADTTSDRIFVPSPSGGDGGSWQANPNKALPSLSYTDYIRDFGKLTGRNQFDSVDWSGGGLPSMRQPALSQDQIYHNPQQTMQQALDAYNAKSMDIDPKWINYLSRAQDYFEAEGKFEPGSTLANQNTLSSAIKQWGHDDTLSGLDKFMNFAIPAVVLSGLTMGFGAALGGTAAATGTATGTATGAVAGATTGAATGGMFVGTNSVIGLHGFGSALADAVANGAVQGATMSAVTGGDPLKGALSGAIGGGVGVSLPDNGAIVNAGISGAVKGGVNAALYGGDILKGAVAGGASGAGGAAASGMINGPASIKGAAGGAVAGGIGALVNGGDVGSAMLKGGVTGGVSGAGKDLGLDPVTSGVIGNFAGSAMNGGVAPITGVNQTNYQTQKPGSNGLTFGFAPAIPLQYQQVTRKDMNWGNQNG